MCDIDPVTFCESNGGLNGGSRGGLVVPGRVRGQAHPGDCLFFFS